MEPYANTGRAAARRGPRVNALGALVSFALGLCLCVLSMAYAVGLHVTDVDQFRRAADEALVQTGVLTAQDAERFAQETIGYLTGRRAAWLSAVTVGGQAVPVPEAFAAHMAQVRRWVTAFRFVLPLMILNIVLLIFLTLVGAMALKTRMFAARSYLLGAFIPLLLAGAGFAWAALDFASFWDVLHQALIPGGIFAAGESVMQLFPLTLFAGYTAPIALTFSYCLVLVALLPALLLFVDRRARRRRMERERQAPYQPMEYR